MASKTDTAKKKVKKKSAKAAGEQEPRGGKDEATPYSSIATHPRARTHVRKAKGWGGLAGFVIAAALSLRAGVPAFAMLERALIFGVVGYLVAWAVALFVWRELMVAEQRAAVQELERRRAEIAAAREREQSTPPAKAAAGS